MSKIVATFDVRIGARTEADIDRGTAIVERYLYEPLHITGTEWDGGLGLLTLHVQGTYDDLDTAIYRVNSQRDRLSSGLYASTEPAFSEQPEEPYRAVDPEEDDDLVFGDETKFIGRDHFSPQHGEYWVTVAVVHSDDAQWVVAALNAYNPQEG